MTSLPKTPSVVDSSAAYGQKPNVAKNRKDGVVRAEAKQAPVKPDETQVQSEKALEKQVDSNRKQNHEQKANKLASFLAKQNVKMKNVRLQFEVDSDSRQVVIKVMDRESGELIRQIPPEEMRHVSKVLSSLADQKGFIVNDVT